MCAHRAPHRERGLASWSRPSRSPGLWVVRLGLLKRSREEIVPGRADTIIAAATGGGAPAGPGSRAARRGAPAPRRPRRRAEKSRGTPNRTATGEPVGTAVRGPVGRSSNDATLDGNDPDARRPRDRRGAAALRSRTRTSHNGHRALSLTGHRGLRPRGVRGPIERSGNRLAGPGARPCARPAGAAAAHGGGAAAAAPARSPWRCTSHMHARKHPISRRRVDRPAPLARLAHIITSVPWSPELKSLSVMAFSRAISSSTS